MLKSTGQTKKEPKSLGKNPIILQKKNPHNLHSHEKDNLNQKENLRLHYFHADRREKAKSINQSSLSSSLSKRVTNNPAATLTTTPPNDFSFTISTFSLLQFSHDRTFFLLNPSAGKPILNVTNFSEG